MACGGGNKDDYSEDEEDKCQCGNCPACSYLNLGRAEFHAIKDQRDDTLSDQGAVAREQKPKKAAHVTKKKAGGRRNEELSKESVRHGQNRDRPTDSASDNDTVSVSDRAYRRNNYHLADYTSGIANAEMATSMSRFTCTFQENSFNRMFRDEYTSGNRWYPSQSTPRASNYDRLFRDEYTSGNRWYPSQSTPRASNYDRYTGDDLYDTGRRGEDRPRLILWFQPASTTELSIQSDYIIPALHLRLNAHDISFCLRFFEINDFHIHFIVHNTLYFEVANRNVREVTEKVRQIKSHVKHIIFSRFCGEVVNGVMIASPDDVVCSFGLQVMNGNMPGVPSTTMFA